MLSRSNNMTVQQIKEEIEKLKGKRINMSVNQGRKKFVNFEGVIQDTYKSIFVVRLLESTKHKTQSHLPQGSVNNIDANNKNLDSTNTQSAYNDGGMIAPTLNRKAPPDADIKYDSNPIIETPTNPYIDLRTYSYIDILCGNVDIDGFLSK